MNTASKLKQKSKRRRGMMGCAGDLIKYPHSAWQKEATVLNMNEHRTLYIHIPFCNARCSFCLFYFGKAASGQLDIYVDMLEKELEHSACKGKLGSVPVNAVYFGGGTPTDMTPEHFTRLLSRLKKSYNLTNDCEITIEGRVAGFSDDKIKACIDNGVNRFSIGVQTFDTALRRSFGRIADQGKTIDLLTRLHSYNQAAVTIDLLYGLPGQTLETWIEDQRIATEMVPLDGICHYSLGVPETVPLAKGIINGSSPAPPDENLCYEMYKAGEHYMKNIGAVCLSVKHYALTNRERNANNDISVHKNSCLPFGIKAGGRIGDYFFYQTGAFDKYCAMVKEGEKPIETARKVPADYRVCGILAGQISRNLGINVEKAAAVDEKHKGAIIESTKHFLREWLSERLLLEGLNGWLRFSSKGLFLHKKMATELFETIADVYYMN
ncbi:MAG: radical SAM protein [Lentisphaerae bacterium]|nr:radical SAM protein [Lentisphaerota bacterium]MCP4103307.1 radical SAM protein [Lentisphaerota bacterium]